MITMPSTSASGSAGCPAPDYWIDGSNKDTLTHYFDLESELGRNFGGRGAAGRGGCGGRNAAGGRAPWTWGGRGEVVAPE
uniref:Uncharacterized protein n=1 Tax=Pavo cristatus TaxID=9049 RepID=A0A8C9G2N9_PAVCR